MWIALSPESEPEHVFDEARRRGVLVSASPLFQVNSTPVPGLRLAFCAEPEKRLTEAEKRLGQALRAVLEEKRIERADSRIETRLGRPASRRRCVALR
jgi:DNA-binding transcriptional MocR family regulator